VVGLLVQLCMLYTFSYLFRMNLYYFFLPDILFLEIYYIIGIFIKKMFGIFMISINYFKNQFKFERQTQVI